MSLSKENMLSIFQHSFSNNRLINKIAIYNELVFVNVKTETLWFAIDFWENGTIKLVFRDDATLYRFSAYFLYPFNREEFLFIENKCVNNLVKDIDIYYVNMNETVLVELAKRIIDKFLLVGKDISLQAEISNMNLKTLNDTINLQVENQIFLDMSSFLAEKQLSIIDTLKMVKDKELSIARYGDGEIRIMISKSGPPFQKHDFGLMKELREISTKESDLLVCYPSLLPEEPYWNKYWRKNWAKCKFFLNKKLYGDSFITRPEAFYMYGQEAIDVWKSIWLNKRVCFVTGQGSIFNAEHIIFDNVKECSFIYTKSKNCYEEIDKVFADCKKQNNIDIFLIALGPTGTVLANRLHQSNYRALDIGHLNNSYDTVFNNAEKPEAIHLKTGWGS